VARVVLVVVIRIINQNGKIQKRPRKLNLPYVLAHECTTPDIQALFQSE
jgi:hypothetical protein